MVEYSFPIDSEHYKAVFSKYRWQNSKARLALVIMAIIATLLVLLSFVYYEQNERGAALAMLLLACFVACVIPLQTRVQIHRSSKHPSFGKTCRWQLTQKGTEAEAGTSKASHEWTAFTEAILYNDGILLMQGPNHPFWLADNRIVSGTREQARELVSDHIMSTSDSTGPVKTNEVLKYRSLEE